MGIVKSTSGRAPDRTIRFLQKYGDKVDFPALQFWITGHSTPSPDPDRFDPQRNPYACLYPGEPSQKDIGIPDTMRLDSESAERLVADEPALKEWLERKFDTNVYFANGLRSNLLEYAVTAQKIESVRLLLEAGVDTNHPNGNLGRTSLHLAAEQASIEILEMLIAHGANVDAIDTRRQTPLHYAVLHHNHHETGFPVIKALIKHGANPLMRTVGNHLASNWLTSSDEAKDWLKQQEALVGPI